MNVTLRGGGGGGGSGDNVQLTLCVEKSICESSLTCSSHKLQSFAVVRQLQLIAGAVVGRWITDLKVSVGEGSIRSSTFFITRFQV